MAGIYPLAHVVTELHHQLMCHLEIGQQSFGMRAVCRTVGKAIVQPGQMVLAVDAFCAAVLRELQLFQVVG